MLHVLRALLVIVFLGSCSSEKGVTSSDENAFSLDELQHRTFRWFWETNYPQYQVPDRYPTRRFSSIAATGFGLTSYIVGAERGYVSRQEAAARVANTLAALWSLPQGPDSTGVSGYKGLFYHFLNYNDATRYRDVELSTIDTGLLMAGVLSAQSYFDGSGDIETQIRSLADSLFRRVEWDWTWREERGAMSMGWRPERGWIPATWNGYNEAMVLLTMALGSPTNPIPDKAWANWCSTYEWENFEGQEHINFSPLFGHQYSHMYIDFRGIQDRYTKQKGIDYFQNSIRATIANKSHCVNNPGDFVGYSEDQWGLTACDGPANEWQVINGDSIRFHTYWARGASSRHIRDDGTIAPTAVGGSVPFAPEDCIAALEFMWDNHYNDLVDSFGFKDAFNLTYRNDEHPDGWYDHDQLGIDQGPILIQIENYRTELIWNVMKRNPYIIAGLQKAGFEGGWLDQLR